MLVVPGFGDPARAQDAKALGTQLSDGAFALLNSLTAAPGSANPALGAVASFAGDAQSLSGALNAGDQANAGHAMAALIADRSAVDAALAAHPGTLKASDWNSLKQQVDQIAKLVKPVAGPVAAAAPAASSSTSAPSASEPPDGPKVHIDSYAVKDHVVKIRGYFEGDSLKSAGIYDGDQLVRDLKVEQLPGKQRVNFDIELGQVEPGMVLRVYDGAGLSAEASVATRLGVEGTGGAKEVEIGPSSDEPIGLGTVTEGAEDADSNGRDSSGHNIAEIPSSGPSSRHSVSKAHARLGDIQVSVVSASLDDPDTHTYDVMGQINGTGVNHAGIYVDGRLAKQIDVDTGDTFTAQPFDEDFQMFGKQAAIRVYDDNGQYLERPLRLAEAPAPPIAVNLPPPAIVTMNPNRLAVQITALKPVTPNATTVYGQVQGKNMATAGLYQGGMQVQTISVSRGLFGMLSSSDSFRQVNFSVQFNPAFGPASVRVYDNNGQYAEQAIATSGPVPYAGANTYGPGPSVYSGPVYGSPPPGAYGNPYNNPYGPQYASPYGYPNSPPPSSSNAPWWMKMMH